MIDKKLTRKEFLLSILSIGAVIAASKIPTLLHKPMATISKEANAYGNNSYGGTKKHV